MTVEQFGWAIGLARKDAVKNNNRNKNYGAKLNINYCRARQVRAFQGMVGYTVYMDRASSTTGHNRLSLWRWPEKITHDAASLTHRSKAVSSFTPSTGAIGNSRSTVPWTKAPLGTGADAWCTLHTAKRTLSAIALGIN